VVEEPLEELEPMFGHLPCILAGGVFEAGAELVVELELEDVFAVVELDRLTRVVSDGLARIAVFAMAWWAAGAAPAEVTPRPIPVPTTAALMAATASAFRRRRFIDFSFVLL
jgi:hypothetical protein